MKLGQTHFGNLLRWDVKSLLAREELAGSYATIGAVSKRVTRRADSHVRLGSIHFDGTISYRDESATIKAGAFLAKPGDLVFSKIDARNGAVAVVTDEVGPVAFSSEYPILEFDPYSELLPDYIAVLCQTPRFRRSIRSLAAGHSGRRRVTPEDMYSLQVPRPSVPQQQRLVDDYNSALAAAKVAGQDVNARQEVMSAILTTLHIQTVIPPTVSRTFHRPFSELPSWSVRRATTKTVFELPAGKYEIHELGSRRVARILRGISKNPSNRPNAYATPYIRVANIRPGSIDLSEVKLIDVHPSRLETLRLRQDDLIVCRNNSLELVGKTARWRSEIESCVHDDHSFRVRLWEPRKVLPEYLEAYLNTPFARQWFEDGAQITTNLAGIPGEVLGTLPVVLPPIALQRQLAEAFQEALLKEQEAQTVARTIREVAILRFESEAYAS